MRARYMGGSAVNVSGIFVIAAGLAFRTNELIKKNLDLIVANYFTYTRRLAYDKISFIRGDVSTSI